MNNKRSGYFFFYVNVMCTNNICRRGLGLASYLLIMPEATSSHLDVIGFSFFFFSPYFVIDRRRHHPCRKEINLEIHLLVFSADELERTRGIQTKLQLIILTFSQLEKRQFRRTSFFYSFSLDPTRVDILCRYRVLTSFSCSYTLFSAAAPVDR